MRGLPRNPLATAVARRCSAVCGCRLVELARLMLIALPLGAALLTGLACRQADAQALLAEEEKAGLDAKPEKKSPFVLVASKVDTLEALDDFRHAVRKGTWEKAFKQIETLLAEPAVGLVPTKDGLLVPLSTAVAIDLAALPPGGQDAYRLFHDAEAKKLWEELQGQIGPDEMTKLARLSTLDLITSVGDLAANRLGDVLFEQGDMLGAIDAWQRVLDLRPDSSLSRPLLSTKIGVALSNAGRWSELAEVERQLKTRYAGETVTIGGAKVVATEHVAALIARHQAMPSVVAGSVSPDLAFADDAEPVWQFLFESRDRKNRQVIQNQRWNRWGMMQSTDLFDQPVGAVVTQTSLFANWMGCDFALDLASGKMRWRNGRFHDIAQRMRQNNVLAAADNFTVVVDGDELWTVTQPVPKAGGANPNQNQNMNMNMNQQQGRPGGPLQVVRRDPATGKELFRTGEIEEFKQFQLLGTPLPADGMLYLMACKLNQPADLHVLAVQPSTQRVKWNTHIGTYQFNPLQRTGHAVKPTMLLSGARLYVDAQAGGLVELAASSGAIRWAYNYPAQMPKQQQWWNWGDDDEVHAAFGPSGPVVAGGELLIKGMQSPRLLAVRPDGSALRWKRSVPQNAMVAGIDDQQIYLACDELLAFDLKTQKLVWANKLPVKSSSIVPLVTEHRYYQFTPRGLYEIDKATGDVVRLFRGADRDCGGGAILTTPNLMITISNRAITAYPLKPPSQAATASLATRGA
jgi:outer membrane protein assembly factor BamB